MEKQFWVNIHYFGAVQMLVNAEDEDEAKEIAEQQFSQIDDSELRMDDWNIDSVQEVK